MKSLRKRMIEDMTLAGLSEGTQKAYVRAVASFALEFDCSPECISECPSEKGDFSERVSFRVKITRSKLIVGIVY